MLSTRQAVPSAKNERSNSRNRLYSFLGCKYEDTVHRRITCILARPERFPGGRFKSHSPNFAVLAKKDFREVALDLLLRLVHWFPDVKPRAEYASACIGENDAIPYWRCGTLEACAQLMTCQDPCRSWSTS